MSISAMKQAAEALEVFSEHGGNRYTRAADALRQAIAEAQKQEPVAVWELQEDGWDTIADPDWMEKLPVGTKLYTAPPKREWVGLTEVDIYDAMDNEDEFEFARAIEAKLKEKNR